MDAPVDKPTEIRPNAQDVDESGEAVNGKPKQSRLSVNITPATQAALDRVVEREGVTLTEALRRLVGYGDLVYETTQIKEDDILIRSGDTVERIVLI